jgi:uncharacterized protein (TIGR03083 family)
LLEEQCVALADWLDEVPVNAHFAEPVGLGDWTVRDLVAHLSLGIGLSRFVTAAAAGATTLSFGDYVGRYPPSAEQIDRETHDLVATLGDEDLVAALRRTAQDALASLDAISGETIQARRGPIARDDFLMTRLVELVVHGDDLQRALGRTDAPLLPEAITAAAAALAAAYEERTGRTTSGDGLEWIRKAAGRVPSDDPQLPLL